MAQYIHIGIFLITVPNLIVIVLMLFVFALAVMLHLPQEPQNAAGQGSNLSTSVTQEADDAF